MAELDDFDPTDDNNTGRWPENMQFSAVNNAGRADEGILARWWQDNNGSLTASGSSNAFTVSSNRTIGALYDDLTLCFTANHSITGSCTLNLNGLGAKAIRSPNGANLGSGAIVEGQPVKVIYKNGPDAWLMVSAPAHMLGYATTSTAGVIELADDAEMEAASSTDRAVTPGRQHHHPGHPKAWGYVTVSGGKPTLAASYNIASITDVAQGRLGVTIDNDMSSAAYCAICTCQTPSTGAAPEDRRAAEVDYPDITAGSVQFGSFAHDADPEDPKSWHFMILGDM